MRRPEQTAATEPTSWFLPYEFVVSSCSLDLLAAARRGLCRTAGFWTTRWPPIGMEGLVVNNGPCCLQRRTGESNRSPVRDAVRSLCRLNG